jgi:6-phosphogluconolactonase
MRFTFVSTIVLSLFTVAGAALAADNSTPVGMVYTMTNASSGNAVLAYMRSGGGQLTPAGSYPTGGLGTGAGLGSQGSLILSRSQQWLLAVNAGSDQISVFGLTNHGLRLTDVVSSGGATPISLTSAGPLVYVVNAGSDSIAGFKLSATGMLTPIPGSIQSLSGSGVGAAQIAFDPEGEFLVVTEKNTNLITVFAIGSGGAALPGQSTASSGMTPFGFAFGRHRALFVSEAFGGAANGSAVSSYRLSHSGVPQIINGSLPDNQTAACWVVMGGGGRFAYTSNTGSNNLSSYLVEFDGEMALFQSQAAVTGAGPIDMTVTGDGRLLYVLNSGDGTIGGYRVLNDGRLTAVLTGVAGLPAGGAGLAAQ